MSIRTAAAMVYLHLPTIRLPKWPRFALGKQVSDTAEAYAQATSVAYTLALGLTSKSRTSEDYDY